MFRKFWNKYKNSLKKEYLVHILIAIGLAGILCAVFSESGTTETEHVPELVSQEAYRETLQSELAGILSRMDGVGRAEVFVTLSGSETCHYAQDSQNRYVTAGSRRDALIESVSLPEVTGVVVACEGGSSLPVQETVYQAVSVACGLKLSQIFVTKLQ